MKKIMIIFFTLLVCSCSRMDKPEYHIKTIIEETTNTMIAINYPITNIKQINKYIKKYVNNTYNIFLEEYDKISFLDKKHELNIDYNYSNLANRYISIILFKHIGSSDNQLIINEVYNYVYDINKNKKINFKEVYEDDSNIKNLIDELLIEKYGNIINIDKIASIDYDNLPFSIDKGNVTIFFEGSKIGNNYNEILTISIPISYFNKLTNLVSNNEKIVLDIHPTINYIDISKPVVALTFDDGPSIYTDEILDTLKQYNSNATFFVLGNKIDAHSDTIIKMYENGNEIGNHSYNHRWLTKLSAEEQREQILKTQEAIKKYTNFTPLYLRPTYGSINKKLRNNTNLNIVLWTVDTKDWKYKNINKIVDNALKDTKDESVILMHDTYERTSEAVKILVPKLIENGYQLVTISELKEIQKIKSNLNEKR